MARVWEATIHNPPKVPDIDALVALRDRVLSDGAPDEKLAADINSAFFADVDDALSVTGTRRIPDCIGSLDDALKLAERYGRVTRIDGTLLGKREYKAKMTMTFAGPAHHISLPSDDPRPTRPMAVVLNLLENLIEMDLMAQSRTGRKASVT